MFVGALGLAAAEKGVYHGMERIGPPETLDNDTMTSDVKCLECVATGMDRRALPVEPLREGLHEGAQRFGCGVKGQIHGTEIFEAKVSHLWVPRLTVSAGILTYKAETTSAGYMKREDSSARKNPLSVVICRTRLLFFGTRSGDLAGYLVAAFVHRDDRRVVLGRPDHRVLVKVRDDVTVSPVADAVVVGSYIS